MKKLEMIVPDRRLDDINRILREANVGGLSYSHVEGRGKGKAQEISVGRGVTHFTPQFITRLKIEVKVRDDEVDAILAKVLDKIGGQPPGGKIFVIDVPDAIDLGTKGREEAAI